MPLPFTRQILCGQGQYAGKSDDEKLSTEPQQAVSVVLQLNYQIRPSPPARHPIGELDCIIHCETLPPTVPSQERRHLHPGERACGTVVSPECLRCHPQALKLTRKLPPIFRAISGRNRPTRNCSLRVRRHCLFRAEQGETRGDTAGTVWVHKTRGGHGKRAHCDCYTLYYPLLFAGELDAEHSPTYQGADVHLWPPSLPDSKARRGSFWGCLFPRSWQR